jgi:ubiquinone/menaquinone biosynthesis C-methylase UbiE
MDYYRISHQASSEIGTHAGLLYLQKLCQQSANILDIGCGEGTRLHTLLPPGKSGTGIDPSRTAITSAKKQYPKNKYHLGVGENLPFSVNTFDLVYSAFSIEHSQNPQKFFQEMVRVCQPNGRILVLAPNYGAPNRRSPNSVENPIKKLILNFFKDFATLSCLSWTAVTPQEDYRQIDADTTWEPYLYSLIKYAKKLNLELEYSSSLWSLESKTLNPRKLGFWILGLLNIWPFKFWGPQLFAVFKK